MAELANLSENLDEAAIEQLCRSDLNIFAAICMPDEVEFPFPPFYHQVWILLIQVLYTLKYPDEEIPESIRQLAIKRVFRFALGLPRAHAKTTFIKLLVAYAILYGLVDFILIVCSTEPRAYNFLADVADILSSPNIKNIYGSWNENLRTDSLSMKRGQFNGRDLILVAIGASTSIRGLNLGNNRPDMILFDDAQTKENDNSPTERKALLEWIVGTAIKTRNMRKCFIAYVGNMYSKDCVLQRFKSSPSWHSLVTGGILADNTALWEELIPLDSLLDEYLADASVGLGHVWFAEIQNDPIGSRRSLLPDGVLPAPMEFEAYEVLGAFLTIDPAGNKKKSDANVITAHYLLTDNRIVVTEIRSIQGTTANPETVILAAIELAIAHRVSVIFPEGVAYQETLAFWLEKYLLEYGLSSSIIVQPINPGKASKTSRIQGYVASILSGLASICHTLARSMFTYQALSYDFDRQDNADDILDSAAMGELVRASYLHLVHIRTELTNVVPIGVAKGVTPIDAYARRSR